MKNIHYRDQIITKALRDSKFKEQLLSNPKETILAFARENWSKEICDNIKDFKFNVYEEQSNTITIVLPHMTEEISSQAAAALNDEELAQIAAAGTITCNSICICR
jgi:hypothetical protein